VCLFAMLNLEYENITVPRNVGIYVLMNRRNIPENLNLQQHRCVNTKSRIVIFILLPQSNQHLSLNIY
jgi:hypothetical protein